MDENVEGPPSGASGSSEVGAIRSLSSIVGVTEGNGPPRYVTLAGQLEYVDGALLVTQRDRA